MYKYGVVGISVLSQEFPQSTNTLEYRGPQSPIDNFVGRSWVSFLERAGEGRIEQVCFAI